MRSYLPIVLVGVALLANFAFVRLKSQVYVIEVLGEVRLLSKGHVALSTGKGALARVDPQVV